MCPQLNSCSISTVNVNNLSQIRPSVERGQQPSYSINVNIATDSSDVSEMESSREKGAFTTPRLPLV